MDEPFAALDAQTRESLQDELLRIWRATGKTVVFITHGIDEAVYLGQRVAVMTPRPGRISDLIDIDLDPVPGEDVRSDPAFGRATGTRSGACSATRQPGPAGTGRSPMTSTTLTRPAPRPRPAHRTDYRRPVRGLSVDEPPARLGSVRPLRARCSGAAPRIARVRRRSGRPHRGSAWSTRSSCRRSPTSLGALADLVGSGQLAEHLQASLTRALVGLEHRDRHRHPARRADRLVPPRSRGSSTRCWSCSATPPRSPCCRSSCSSSASGRPRRSPSWSTPASCRCCSTPSRGVRTVDPLLLKSARSLGLRPAAAVHRR